MSFFINSNIEAFKAYNALSKVNSQTQKAQLRLATGKKINSVADDTSGYAIGMSLQSKSMIQKSQLNNASVAQNYLATAETALVQIDDLITKISAKYVDSQNALTDRSSIANDIKSIASEIDSILKNTKYNDKNLLAQSDGSALASSDVFDVGGDVTMDFAGSSFLDVDTLMTKINGGTGTAETPGATTFTGTKFDADAAYTGDGNINYTIEKDGVSLGVGYPNLSSASTLGDVATLIVNHINGNSFFHITPTFHNNGTDSYLELTSTDSKKITAIYTVSGFDLAEIGISDTNITTSSSVQVGGLLDTDDDTVLTAASDVATISQNVKKALGRIGNLTQTLDQKTDFLSASITNNQSSISRLFDTDMAAEQLNATKGSIAGNAATSMLSQLNVAPQSLLSLFS